MFHFLLHLITTQQLAVSTSNQLVTDALGHIPAGATVKTGAAPVPELVGLPGLGVSPLQALLELGYASLPPLGVSTIFPPLWPALKYLWAFASATPARGLHLSAVADQVRFHHRTAMSEELGIAFCLRVARYALEQRHGTTDVRIVDADMNTTFGALMPHYAPITAAPGATRRPDYFATVYDPALGVRYYTIEVKGSKKKGYHKEQLGSALAQVASVVGPGGMVPDSLALALYAGSDDLKVYAIDPDEHDWVKAPDLNREVPAQEDTVRIDSAGKLHFESQEELLRLLYDASDMKAAHLAGRGDLVTELLHRRGDRRTDRHVEARATRSFDGEQYRGIDAIVPGPDITLKVFMGVADNRVDAIASSRTPETRWGTDRALADSDTIASARNSEGIILTVERA